MSKKREMQRLIRAYRDETGKREIDMKDVAKWAVGKGWPLPVPRNPIDILAQNFAEAAREETRKDTKPGARTEPTTRSPLFRAVSSFICGLILTKLSADRC